MPGDSEKTPCFFKTRNEQTTGGEGPRNLVDPLRVRSSLRAGLAGHATTRVFCRGHVCTQALTGLTGETRTRRFARSTTRAGATRRGDPPGPRGRSRPARVHFMVEAIARGVFALVRRGPAPAATMRPGRRRARAAARRVRGSVRPCLLWKNHTRCPLSVRCPLSSRSRLLSSRTLATVCHAINRVVNSHRGSTTSAASLLGLACARARLRTLCVPVQKRTWY